MTEANDLPFPSRLLKYRQAADLLGITVRTLSGMVSRGEIPVIRFGRSVRIDPADLRRFIDQSKREGRL